MSEALLSAVIGMMSAARDDWSAAELEGAKAYSTDLGTDSIIVVSLKHNRISVKGVLFTPKTKAAKEGLKALQKELRMVVARNRLPLLKTHPLETH